MASAKIHFFGEEYSRYKDIGSQDIYEYLVRRGVDEEEAIDCDSWAEIADLDEEYTGEGYSVMIVED